MSAEVKNSSGTEGLLTARFYVQGLRLFWVIRRTVFSEYPYGTASVFLYWPPSYSCAMLCQSLAEQKNA